ncbi:AMP-binding protein [uncultured Rhodospira sp.]|uniref:AMP-binding protein n=1 Tax=uncultured Rhodospira sp. TaxID=1936189 RepID=UPI00261BEECA|nr:AMP-binding protein [uncultured Rhodospira sp.]
MLCTAQDGQSAVTASSLVGGLLAQVARQPEAPALVWREETVTYGALHTMARAAASRLRALGLVSDAPVGLVAHKSPRAIATILGCLMVGQRFVLPSTQLAHASLTALLEGAGCSRVLTPDQATAAAMPELGAVAVFEDHAPSDMDDADAEVPADYWFPAALGGAAEADCFLLTTSGSTGLPKVVPLSVGAVDAFTDWALDHFDIGPETTALNLAPLNFDLCLLDIWAVLKGGGRVVLVEQDLATNAAYLLRMLDAIPINIIQSVPMFYNLIVHDTHDTPRSFPAVKHAIFTGDSISRSTLAALPSLFPAARLHNIYGCTETNDSFLYEMDPARVDEPGPVPIGHPLPGVHALVLDETGAPVEGTGMGELVVSTPFQSRGYLDPARNAGKFFDRNDGGVTRAFFHTGDLVCRHPDGTLTLEGRKDFRVKVRGVLVNPQEVERIILGHDQVLEAAVLAIPDDTAGHLLHAFVHRKIGAKLNSLTLRQHCAAQLPRMAIPSRIDFVIAALPKTSTGKLDRRQLLRSCLEGESHDLSRVHQTVPA